MLQPKDTDWLNGYKNKTHIYAVYKKPTSDLKKNHVGPTAWQDEALARDGVSRDYIPKLLPFI